MMKTVLVTGGAGYVGAVLVPKLLAQGYHTKVLDLFLYADESIFPADLPNRNKLEILRGDLRDRAFVELALKNTDAVINLAGISNDPSSDLDPELTKEVNIRATQFLIDRARDLGVQRFINASSSSVYGIKEEANVTEDLALEPLTIYSESKVVIEDYLRHHRKQMTTVSIRSATVCGFSPRMRLDLTVNILTHFAMKKGMIKVFGGIQKRPNIHIADITDLYVSLLTTPKHLIDGQEFNACGANHTVMEIATLVKETVAPEVPIEVVPTNDLRSYHISAKRIQSVLNFRPKHSIKNAIEDVAEAFKLNKISHPEEDKYYNVKVMKNLLHV